MIDYVCVINKNHLSSFDTPQAAPPQCCGKPMVLALPAGSKAPVSPAPQLSSAQPPAVTTQPAAAPATPQAQTMPAKSPAQQPKKGARRRKG